MKNTITLPMGRVAALVVETQASPEVSVAKLLSVLHARAMWAHLDEKRSTKSKAVFIYGVNVPTLCRARVGKTARKATDIQA